MKPQWRDVRWDAHRQRFQPREIIRAHCSNCKLPIRISIYWKWKRRYPICFECYTCISVRPVFTSCANWFLADTNSINDCVCVCSMNTTLVCSCAWILGLSKSSRNSVQNFNQDMKKYEHLFHWNIKHFSSLKLCHKLYF